jgi:protein TonB
VQRIASEVAQANLVSSVSPEYPGLARAARVQGTVFLLASISSEGTVTDLIVLQGHPLLNDAAIQAVKQWRYKPQLVGGQAMPVQTTVTVNFSFQ